MDTIDVLQLSETDTHTLTHLHNSVAKDFDFSLIRLCSVERQLLCDFVFRKCLYDIMLMALCLHWFFHLIMIAKKLQMAYKIILYCHLHIF